MSIITEAHIDAALDYIAAHPKEYDQRHWCGTARCVWGHACTIAGIKERDGGPEPEQVEDTPRAQTLQRLMYCPSPDILRVMRAVDAEGVIQLAGANLRGAKLTDASLTDANLRGADLREAALCWANLIRADLRGANLSEADLLGADLTGADLTGADLSDADLTDADLTDAVGLEATT